jgi:hypothetical protein
LKSGHQEHRRWQQVVLGIVVGFAFGAALDSLYKAPVPLLTSKLLEWPFLTFILIVGFVLVFFGSIEKLIARGELTIAWSKDHSIKVRDLAGALDEELDPIRDDIELLKTTLDSLLDKRKADPHSIQTELSPESRSTDKTEISRTQRLRDALANPKYEWRSVERLAILMGVTEDDVIRLILSQDDIRLSRGKSGRQIVGLVSRVGRE